MELRPYQVDAVKKARINFAEGVRRQLIYSPTGSGKTEIAINIIRSAVSKGKKVAFIANRIGLVEQAARRLHASGLDVGIIQGANTLNLSANVLVCSIQTVARRGMPDVDVIVIDEAHGCAGSRDYQRVIQSYSNIPIIGLSATPFSKGLGKEYEYGALFERMVVASTIRGLIDQGFLVDCDIYAPTDPDLTGVSVIRNSYGEKDYNEKELAIAVDKPGLVGDIVTHWKRLGEDKPTVVFASSIAHSKHISDRFNESGVMAEHIDAYTDSDERLEILGRVTSGKTKVISNCSLLAEGWDFPACGVMILARPTKSLTRWIQMAGRVLRPYPGKVRAIVIDHSGSAAELGYPTDDLPLELDDGSTRPESAKKKKEEKKPSKCPSCQFMKAPGVHSCPRCGFAPQKKPDIITDDGDLKLLKRGTKSSIGDKQSVYSQLLSEQLRCGYKSGWLAHTYKEIFGVWPRGMVDIPKPVTNEVSDWLVHKRIAYSRKAA